MEAEETLQALRRALALAEKFSLLVCVVETSADRHRYMAALSWGATPGTIHFLWLQSPPQDWAGQLKTNEGPLHLGGFEHWGEELIGALHRLNAAREEVAVAFPYPLVLWLSAGSFRALSEHAPDFFSIRSGTFFFPSQATRTDFRILWGYAPAEIVLTPAGRTRRVAEVQRLLPGIRELMEQAMHRLHLARLWELEGEPQRALDSLNLDCTGVPGTMLRLHRFAIAVRLAAGQELFEKNAISILAELNDLGLPDDGPSAQCFLTGRYIDAYLQSYWGNPELVERHLVYLQRYSSMWPDGEAQWAHLTAACQIQRGEFDAARESLLQAVKQTEAKLSSHHPHWSLIQWSQARLLHLLGNWNEARALGERCLQALEPWFAGPSRELELLLGWLAGVCRDIGDDQSACTYQRLAESRRVQPLLTVQLGP